MAYKHPSIVSALEKNALTQPDKAAFIFVDQFLERLVLTRKDVWDYSRKFAAKLRKTGLRKGDVVCNTLRNSPQRVVTELGTITAGAISMNGQICYADGSDFISSLNRAQARCVILDPGESKGAFHQLQHKLEHFDADSGKVACPDVPSLEYIISYSLTTGRGNDLLDELDKEREMVQVNIDPQDVCQYMCTSGSTSFFKLVAFNSQDLLEFGVHMGGNMKATEDDVLLSNRPLGWLGGYPSVYLVTGLTRVLFDDSHGRPDNFWEIVWKIACQEKCTISFLVPLSLVEVNAAREQCEKDEFSNYKLKCLMSGGGPVTTFHMEAALGKLADEVSVVYACTEAGVCSRNWVTDLSQFEEFNTGCPVPGAKIMIVDSNQKEIPFGEKGEIFIRTTQSALKYVDQPEETSQVFRSDGWIRLGDIGIMNAQGQLKVLGRNKFAILRGAIVYYPEVIETFLRGCPGVKEVAVTGVPDEKLFEQICAYIIKQPGIKLSGENVKLFCDDLVVSKDVVAPVPEYFFFVESFPLLSNGKLDRVTLKKLASEMVNLQANTSKSNP